jgi:F-type H+-transporting ATPase subunit a
MFIINPLNQFKIIIYDVIFNIPITNFFIYMCIAIIFISLFFYINLLKVYLLPTIWQNNIEFLYDFVLQIMKQQINNIISLKYFPLVFNIFILILIFNINGLLPYSFTITSQIIVTLQLALSMFIGIIIIGFYNKDLKFLLLFVPKNIPKILVPFLTLIEVVSFLIRPFSLSVRLFANMLAGHTLLFIIASFNFFIAINYILVLILPLFFIFFILILEFAIAFVQAYIFVILISIYLNDLYDSH